MLSDGAEAAFSIEKEWQSSGVGTVLLERTLLSARNRGIKHMRMDCLASNRRMQQLARKFEAGLTFDFGSVVPLSGFDFFDRIPAVDRTTAFNLIFSNDTTFGNAGDTTLSFTSGSTVWGYSQTFAAVNARYVRFDATATTGAGNNSGMQEIMF